jgi:cytochrome c-type biogenesis protein CcmH
MMLWVIFALMTGAAIFAVLWPLGRKSDVSSGGSDLVVYRDQLEEIGRDRAAGLIGAAEAEAARIEVSRRLLAAADAPPAIAPFSTSIGRRRAAALAALLVLPVIACGFYSVLGSPNIPGQSAFARLTTPLGQQSLASLIGQVEAHLARNPNDGAGWEVIAPVYLRLGRFDDAVQARRKALALNGETATRDSDLGEALVAAANGVVTEEAKTEFQQAVARDKTEPKARYFLGLADEQDGNRDGAAARWRALITDSPPDAPWLPLVRAALASVAASGEPSGTAEGPNAEETAAAATMSDEQRNQMIRGMVAKLADQLHADGSNVEGWLRLVRDYVVLGDRDRAKDAAADARRALAAHPDEVKRVDDLVKEG